MKFMERLRGSGGSMELYARPLKTPENPVALTDLYKVIKRFNRYTTWVATGLLGTVIFAALVLAFQERQPKAPDLERQSHCPL